VLGAVAAGYGIDVYGTLSGPLHRGTPTDRLMTEWWIVEPHVARRVAGREGARPDARLSARSAEVMEAPEVLQSAPAGEWSRPIRPDADPDWAARRVLVAVPPRFSELQQRDRELAMAWRLAMRDVMTQAFGHGYRAVDFYLNREQGGGSYLLAKT
jgi:predicted GNAT superfamily acetyltransferase